MIEDWYSETEKSRWWKFKKSELDSNFVEKLLNTNPKFYVIVVIIGIAWLALWIWDGLKKELK